MPYSSVVLPACRRGGVRRDQVETMAFPPLVRHPSQAGNTARNDGTDYVLPFWLVLARRRYLGLGSANSQGALIGR